MISTSNLTGLPNVASLRDVMRSMAMLDAILCPDWDGRYYSFDSCWAKGEEMGSMRNGSGDELFALFNSYGCFLKGFVHDSPLASQSRASDVFYQGIPEELSACVSEPAFSTDDVTFCLWRSKSDTQWNRNVIELPEEDDHDGSAYLLSPFDGNPETYWLWAEDYYEQDVDRQAVKAIYERQRLTEDLVKALNPNLSLRDLREDLRTIGYPT